MANRNRARTRIEAEGGDLTHRLLADWPAYHLLGGDEEEVPAVERQDRQQIEQSQIQTDQGQKRQEEAPLDRRAPDRGDSDGTGNVLVEVLLAGYQLPDERPEL